MKELTLDKQRLTDTIYNMIELESKLLNISYRFTTEWNWTYETIWRGYYSDYFIIPNALLNLEFQIFINFHTSWGKLYVVQFWFERGCHIE